MIRSLQILIERVEHCLVVLTKMYNLLTLYTQHHNDRPPFVVDEDILVGTIPFAEAEDDELLTVNAACCERNIGRSTLSRLRKEGRIQAVTQGASVRFRKQDIDRLRAWYSVPKGKV